MSHELKTLPRVLALHLKRFVPNVVTHCYEKNSKFVDIPEQIDLGKLVISQFKLILVQASFLSDENEPPEPFPSVDSKLMPTSPQTAPKKTSAQYELRGICFLYPSPRLPNRCSDHYSPRRAARGWSLRVYSAGPLWNESL